MIVTDPLQDIFPDAETAVDPLDNIFSQAKTTVISTIGAPAEKSLDLGALANIHIKGKVPSSAFKIGSLEFMFLQENKWYRFDAGLGRIIPVNDADLTKYGDRSKYLLLGPMDPEAEGKKSGVRDFALYELESKGFYR